jgi:hypothetical protein
MLDQRRSKATKTDKLTASTTDPRKTYTVRSSTQLFFIAVIMFKW